MIRQFLQWLMGPITPIFVDTSTLRAEVQKTWLDQMQERMTCGHARRFLQFPRLMGPSGENDSNFCVACETYWVGFADGAVGNENAMALRDKAMRELKVFSRDGAAPLDEGLSRPVRHERFTTKCL